MLQTGRPENISRGIAFIVLAMTIFACQDAIIKHLSQDYSAIQVVWVRFLFFPIFAVVMAWRKGSVLRSLVSRRPFLQVIRCCMLLADMLLFVIAVRVLPLADTHALLASFPLIVVALSALFLGEHVGPRRWMAVVICFVGVLIILRPGLTVFQPSSGIVLLIAMFLALYTVLTRAVSRYDSSETSLLYLAIVGLVVTSAMGPFFWTWPTWQGWIWFAVISLTGAIGHFILILSLEMAPASILQPYNYVLLLGATILGFVFFGHFPDFWTIIGSCLIVGSGLYAFMRERQIERAGRRTASQTAN